jgi:hypothetical protein
MNAFAAYVGIVWSDQKHDLCLVDAAMGRKEFSALAHSSEAIDTWATSLRARFPGRKIAACLEQSRGPLIYALLKYDFLVLYPINPSTLSNYREAFSPSGAKDDPTDADFLAEIVSTHRDRLRPWQPDDEKTRCLQHMVEPHGRASPQTRRRAHSLKQSPDGFAQELLPSGFTMVPRCENDSG